MAHGQKSTQSSFAHVTLYSLGEEWEIPLCAHTPQTHNDSNSDYVTLDAALYQN